MALGCASSAEHPAPLGELPLVAARLELSERKEDDPEGPASWVLRVARPDPGDPGGTRQRAAGLYERLSGR